MQTSEWALAWMKEECAAADDPRFSAAGESDIPGEPHCDCHASLTALLDKVRAEEREACANVADEYRRADNTMLESAAEYIAKRIRERGRVSPTSDVTKPK